MFLHKGIIVIELVKNFIFSSIWKVLKSNFPLNYSKMAYHTKYDIIAAVYCEYSKDFVSTTINKQSQVENTSREQKIVVHHTVLTTFKPYITSKWRNKDLSDVRKYLAEVQQVRESNEQYKTITLQSLNNNAYNVKDLKNICKKLKVKVCGKKNKLDDRILTIVNLLSVFNQKNIILKIEI
jgi:hypothetical protein